MHSTIVKLWRDERGATTVEYALMAAAITAVIVAVVFALGVWTSGAFTGLDTKWAAH